MSESGDPDCDEAPVSFLGRPAPPGMDVRLVSIPRQSELAYEPSEWAGALVVVEAGEVELECRGGASACFATGSVLFFEGLGLRAVRNAGDEPALLSAVTRRCQQSSAQRRISATSAASQ